MAVERQENWLGQQRVDIPHLRSIESAVAADFDLLAGGIMAGQAPLITSGFYLLTTGITQATQLQLQVANSTAMHFLASESGTIFHVPADRPNEVLNTTNPRITGSFLASQVNYVGLDFVRKSDPTTTDLVQFMDPNELVEDPKSVPLARTLDYTIVISATDFDSTPGVCPIAKVTLDASGNITALDDARNIFWRLGTGGSNPNRRNAYSWPAGRKENTTTDLFAGGDKTLSNMKSWGDALMTRVWELGGGEYWYSPTADRNVLLVRSGSVFSSSGEYFEWDGSNLHWQGLSVTFANSTGIYNDINNQTTDLSGTTDLADGECVYVDLDRTQNRIRGTNPLNAIKANLAVLGTPDVPGSRWVLAWRYGSSIFTRDQSYAVGSAFKLATVSTAGMVRLSATDTGAATPPRVASVDSTSFVAYAGGLTRGNDFFGGAGDLAIGGAGNDHNITLTTTRNQDEVVISGTKDYTTTPYSAPLTVQNMNPFTGSMGADGSNLIARFRGYNAGTSRLETGVTIEACGAIGFRPAYPPNAPNPSAADPIAGKLYFSSNGLSSPNARQQVMVMWSDGSTEVIAEGPPS